MTVCPSSYININCPGARRRVQAAHVRPVLQHIPPLRPGGLPHGVPGDGDLLRPAPGGHTTSQGPQTDAPRAKGDDVEVIIDDQYIVANFHNLVG